VSEARRASGTIRIAGGRPLRGAVELPPDADVTRCALLLGALADGECTIANPIEDREAADAAHALRTLGIDVELGEEGVTIHGSGLGGLRMPSGAVSCGRSYATFALLCGVLAGQRFGARLWLEPTAELGRLEHLIGSLRARGAHIAGTGGEGEPLRPPVAIAPLLPDEPLHAIECSLPEPDPHAKGALLLSGLFSDAPTAVSEPLLSADHVERMLSALGVPLRRLGSLAGFDPSQWDGRLRPFRAWSLPSSTTLAAFVAAAASSIEGSHVALHGVGFNPTRTGCFDALRLLGGRIRVVAKGDRAGHEPIAELQIQSTRTRGGTMGGEIPLRCGDGLPALCLLGARSERGLVLADAEAFAPEEAALWPALAALLRAFGAECEVIGAGLRIHPATRLHGARVDAGEDRRLALTAVIWGLAAEGETLVDNARCIVEGEPGLLPALGRLGAIAMEAT
jgi:3-phosphoshikimate 1-carboxyvinyltransferase